MTSKDEKGVRRLALLMLALAVVGQLAYAKAVYNAATGVQSSFLLSGLAWLRWIVWAGWAALLVRSGYRRLVVGLVSAVLVMVFVTASEQLPSSWQPKADAVADVGIDLSVGERHLLSASADVDGNEFSLENYGDRPVLLIYWRSWCSPCLSEMGQLNELDNAETAKGHLAVIGINSEPIELQKKTRSSTRIRFRLLKQDDEAGDNDVAQFPTNVILWRGRVVDWWTGAKGNLREHVIASLEEAD